jgi:hypothetical protein
MDDGGEDGEAKKLLRYYRVCHEVRGGDCWNGRANAAVENVEESEEL